MRKSVSRYTRATETFVSGTDEYRVKQMGANVFRTEGIDVKSKSSSVEQFRSMKFNIREILIISVIIINCIN